MKLFTLIETIVAIFIFLLAIGAVSAFSVHLYQVNTYTFQQSQAILEARKGIEEMVREVRECTYGKDGSFSIEEAGDNEFVFYSDIDNDGEVERVRYFISPAGGVESYQEQTCQSSQDGGGSCSVEFSNFLSGELDSANVEVSVDGDLNKTNETIDIYADGQELGTLCSGRNCAQCKGDWQALTNFDVTNLATDGDISFTAIASSRVNDICDGISFKVKFHLNWKEKGPESEKSILRKGTIEPTGWPPKYLSSNEKTYTVSRNIMNNVRGKPIFTYYDKGGNEVPLSARIESTSFMCFDIIVNVDPNRPPNDFEVNSCVQLRNLRSEQ